MTKFVVNAGRLNFTLLSKFLLRSYHSNLRQLILISNSERKNKQFISYLKNKANE